MSKKNFFGLLTEASAEVAAAFDVFQDAQELSNVWLLYVVASGTIEPITMKDESSVLLVKVDDGVEAEGGVFLTDQAAKHSLRIILGEDVRCSIVHINAVGDHALSISQKTKIGKGSSLHITNVTLGGSSVEHDVVSHVIGHDAESNIDWMFYAKGTEKQKLSARNIFDAANGRGEISMRGIAEQKGHTVCNGMVEIGLTGGGTQTYLTQEVLMLDSMAKVDAIPALEIKTNDVKASHSATVARVTEEDLFYFGARGIDPAEARRMFILGFLGSITDKITEPATREEILKAIESKYQ